MDIYHSILVAAILVMLYCGWLLFLELQTKIESLEKRQANLDGLEETAKKLSKSLDDLKRTTMNGFNEILKCIDDLRGPIDETAKSAEKAQWKLQMAKLAVLATQFAMFEKGSAGVDPGSRTENESGGGSATGTSQTSEKVDGNDLTENASGQKIDPNVPIKSTSDRESDGGNGQNRTPRNKPQPQPEQDRPMSKQEGVFKHIFGGGGGVEDTRPDPK